MVSVVLASFNGEKYIKNQIDSVLNQSYGGLTLVISDDGSTDNTPAIIRDYEKRYPGRVKSLNHKEHSGSAQNNFFRLLREVSDDYIMLCDQDDIWLPDKVESTLREMKAMEKAYGRDIPLLVHSDLSVTDKEGRICHKSMARHQKIKVSDNRLSHYLVENNITGNTVMINKGFHRFLKSTPKECVMHDWWLGLLASCFGKIRYIDRPLILYRQHGGNQLGSQSGMEQLAKNLGSRERVRENYRKMFRQAELFLTLYKADLSPDQREVLEQFLSIPEKNRAEKIYIIWKYKFLKSTYIRTLGQMFSI